MTGERSQVQYGRTTIAYAIRRSSRRRTAAIAIEPGGAVVVAAPPAVPVERLDRVVHAKARWIVTRLRLIQGLPPALPRREFVPGEMYLYLGRQYRLRVLRRPRAPTAVALVAGWFVVTVDAALGAAARAAAIRRGLLQWYRVHAQVRLADGVIAWASRMRIAIPAILVRDQRQRWASCDRRGVLRFNWRIVQAPRRLLDYVVAHELVHLRHPHHTPAFWSALGKLMPDYEKRKAWLRAIGPRLAW